MRHLNTRKEKAGIAYYTRESIYSKHLRDRIESLFMIHTTIFKLRNSGHSGAGSEFVAYLDAIGEVDGVRCLIDWKTTTSLYPEAPEGLLSLDPQLICYSWISGIPEAALVVFVRRRASEFQYLRATISEEKRQEFGRLVETTASQIEAGHFNPHSGIRFPQNGCVGCPHLGLCLHNGQLVAANLVRRAGASNLDWLDELVD